MVPADGRLVELVKSGRLTGVRTAGAVFVSAPGSASAGELRIAHGGDGVCIFRQTNRCAIHTQAGELALPVSCRHYPRVILRDSVNTRISLSHYCPTAASMLFATGDIEIADAAGRLTVDEPIEGLDARDALPPLLRPGMLTDLDGYNAWELCCVATLAREGDARSALDVIGRATETLRTWKPIDGKLVDRVEAAFDDARRRPAQTRTWDVHMGSEIIRSLASSPLHTVDGDPVRLSTDLERVVANYVAARVFGNWISYQGRGLRTIVAWLHACHDTVRAFLQNEKAVTPASLLSAVRNADLLMLHTVDSQAFARAAVILET